MNHFSETSEPAPATPAGRRRGLALKVALALGIICGLVAVYKMLPVDEFLEIAADWVDSLGFWGPLAFMILYVSSVVLLVPGSVLTAAAGALFGVAYGSVYVSIASTAGATAAFLVGRHFARGWVERRIAGNERFAAIDFAVAQEGWKIVGLTRLSPVFPFTLLNYAYGITKVRLRDYVLASWVGMMPGTILYVYLGSLGKAATEAKEKSPLEWTFYGIGLAVTVMVTIYVTKVARRALQARIGRESESAENPVS